MQHLEGNGTPVLYIGRTLLKVKENSFPDLWVRLEHFDCVCTSLWQFTAYVLMSGVLMPVTVQVRAFRDVTSRSLAEVCGINTKV
jgi:hypothetical protein